MSDTLELSQRAITATETILQKYGVDGEKAGAGFIAEVLETLAANELLTFGFSDPLQTGPQPGDMEKACTVIRLLAERSGTLATIYMVAGLLGPLCLSYAGTVAQKKALLPRVAAGELQLAFALTEPGAGSDAAGITTQATRWDDHYVVRGEKTYITGAATADLILTVARTTEGGAKSYGILLVPGGAEGLSVEPLSKLSGNAYPSCRVMFEEVLVSESGVLGGEAGVNSAWPQLRKTGTLERLIVAAMACGFADAATNRALQFVQERHQFGQPLRDFQAIQHIVVEMSTLATGMRLFLEDAIRQHAEGHDATQAISMAKYFCSDQLQKVVEMAARVMGGRAYFDFEPVSRLYREAPFCLYAGGTIEVQKMLIARSLGI